AEEELRRSQERERLLKIARGEESRGLVELKTSRFAQAEQFFQKGLADLPVGGEYAEVRFRLEALRRDAGRLATFTRYWERAERLALGTEDRWYAAEDDVVIAVCETALRSVGVLGGAADWWNHLPDRELQEGQQLRLRDEAGTALALLAVWRTKRGFLREVGGKKADGTDDYRATIELVGRIQGFVRAESRARDKKERESQPARLLELFCRLRLGEKPAPPPLPLQAQDAAEMYFLGVAHLFLADAGIGSVGGDLLMLPFGEYPKLSGLDLKNPLATAERLLRGAVAVNPRHYMSHYWLGRCLARANDFSAAEQAFNTCAALRPDYVPAYTARAATLLTAAEPGRNKNPKASADLW
ncbi:MAG: tetratricopeptide repeat protein, partial [Thermoleophilia bacterium]|nr:tetratricopeptide repeat protein [Thermoleophilia bacterium]